MAAASRFRQACPANLFLRSGTFVRSGRHSHSLQTDSRCSLQLAPAKCTLRNQYTERDDQPNHVSLDHPIDAFIELVEFPEQPEGEQKAEQFDEERIDGCILPWIREILGAMATSMLAVTTGAISPRQGAIWRRGSPSGRRPTPSSRVGRMADRGDADLLPAAAPAPDDLTVENRLDCLQEGAHAPLVLRTSGRTCLGLAGASGQA